MVNVPQPVLPLSLFLSWNFFIKLCVCLRFLSVCVCLYVHVGVGLLDSTVSKETARLIFTCRTCTVMIHLPAFLYVAHFFTFCWCRRLMYLHSGSNDLHEHVSLLIFESFSVNFFIVCLFVFMGLTVLLVYVITVSCALSLKLGLE